jgi:hypothetical protein
MIHAGHSRRRSVPQAGVRTGLLVRIRLRLSAALVSCVVWLAATGPLFAQAPAAPAAPGGGSAVVVSGRSVYGGAFLTLVLSGAALFVVCRSSRRN